MLQWIRVVAVMVGVMAAASGLAVGQEEMTPDDGLRIGFMHTLLNDSFYYLWTVRPDGTSPELIYTANFIGKPHCSNNRMTFFEEDTSTEARRISAIQVH